MDIHAASTKDLAAVTELLRGAHLPAGDIAPHLANFLVAVADGISVGVVGLEAYGTVGLLRSLAVAPACQKRGLGGLLCQSMFAQAGRLGVSDLYLLTTDASAFFERLGFRRRDRSGVPREIQGTEEFSAICPVSAVVMHRRLE